MTNEPLFTSYKILHQIGLGGMATVYLAEHKTLGHQVAIKVLNKEFTFNQNIRSRFVEEAKKMVRMNHPNVVKVTDLIDEENTVAIVMEYVEGKTLAELSAEHKFSDEEIELYLKQMLQALSYIHKQGLIHRDIKPSNFILGKDGHLKLTDFGISKSFLNNSEHTQTSTSMSLGTPMYMSPEQVRSTKDVTHLTDIYSLGVVLWQLVSGQKPYNSETTSAFDLQLKIVQEDLPLTDTHWDKIIQKATQKEESKRFQWADEFLVVIEKKEVDGDDFERTVFADESIVFVDNQKMQKKERQFNFSFSKKKKYFTILFILIILVCIYFLSFYNSDNSKKIKNSLDILNLKGNVKTIIAKNGDKDFTTKFDKNGNMTYETKFFMHYVFKTKYENFYNQDGKLLKSVSSDSYSKEIKRFFYDKYGNEVKIEVVSFDGDNVKDKKSIIINQYDENGNLVLERRSSKGDWYGKTIYMYDINNKLVKELIFHRSTLSESKKYWYKNDKLAKVESRHIAYYDIDNLKYGIRHYTDEIKTYNLNGDIVNLQHKQIDPDDDFTIEVTESFEYEYDHFGNWIVKTKHQKGDYLNRKKKDTTEIFTRKIVYF